MLQRSKINNERFDSDIDDRSWVWAQRKIALFLSLTCLSLCGTGTADATRAINGCAIDDASAIEHYRLAIDGNIETSRYTLTQIDTSSLSPSVAIEGLPLVSVKKREDMRRTVLSSMDDISPVFLRASGVETIEIRDIKQDFGKDDIGIFTAAKPESIVIDSDLFRQDRYISMDPNERVDSELYVENVILHELGHAAVYKFCGTLNPPEEFIGAADREINPPAGFQKDFISKGYVSKYATSSSREDVAETIQAILGETTGVLSQVNILKGGMATNPVIREKIAVVLTMLDKLQPGLGDIALHRMVEMR